MLLELLYNTQLCMLNLCDNNVYKAQMCTLFYYITDKCTGWLHCGSAPKDGLPTLRGSSANEIPSHSIEQTKQDVWQEDHHS